MIIQNGFQIYTGLYDFAVTGGAIGSYNLEIPVPSFAIIHEFSVCCPVLPTSAGAATVSFDNYDLSVSPPVLFVGSLFAATLIAAWTSTSDVLVGGTEPFKSNVPFSVGISIGAFALTAGQFQITIRATLLDF